MSEQLVQQRAHPTREGRPRQRTELNLTAVDLITATQSALETTVSRHRGRTVTVEGINCSCYCKIVPLQSHY